MRSFLRSPGIRPKNCLTRMCLSCRFPTTLLSNCMTSTGRSSHIWRTQSTLFQNLKQLGSNQPSAALRASHLTTSLCSVRTGVKLNFCRAIREDWLLYDFVDVGEDPRLQGLYHGCGFNSAGMMLGGGCGEQLALWIINGRPDLHMYSYDIRRFTLDEMRNVDWVKERSHESYATNYSIAFPNDQFLAGRNFQTDPFHEVITAEVLIPNVFRQLSPF